MSSALFHAGDIYLDTVTLDTWIRANLADRILGGLAQDGVTVSVEATVRWEATRHLPQAGRAIVTRLLEDHGVQAVDLEATDPSMMNRAVQMARAMTDEQLEAGSITDPKPTANLGEAATIVYILAHDQDAVFVTSDRHAEDVATRAGVDVVRTGAYIGIEIELGYLTLDQVWSAVCDTRDCGLDTQSCKTNGACPNLTDEAIKNGIFGKAAMNRESLRRTVNRDLQKMQELLAKG